MRFEVRPALAAAIGILLSSISFPASGQKYNGGQPRGELQQSEPEPPLARLLSARLTRRQWPQEQPVETEGPRPPEAMTAGTEHDHDQPETEMPRDPRWTALAETGLGTTMDFPRAIFSTADGDAGEGMLRKYRTPDGRAKVAVWTQRNTRRDTPADYLRRTFVIPRATLDYERFTPEFAVVSGVYGSRIYYIRCNLSPRDNLHCFDLAYPEREKKTWDGIVTRMSRSLRPFDD
jgi:hypothetical protein